MDYYLALAQAFQQLPPELQRKIGFIPGDGGFGAGTEPTKAKPKDLTPQGGIRIINGDDDDDRAYRRDARPPLSGDTSHDRWAPPRDLADYEEALRLQREFDNEAEVFRLEMERMEEEAREREFLEMIQAQEKGFDCGICMDEMPVSDIAKVEGCGHDVCRDCLRGYVTSKINDRKYPIPCPLCTGGPAEDGKAQGGERRLFLTSILLTMAELFSYYRDHRPTPRYPGGAVHHFRGAAIVAVFCPYRLSQVSFCLGIRPQCKRRLVQMQTLDPARQARISREQGVNMPPVRLRISLVQGLPT